MLVQIPLKSGIPSQRVSTTVNGQGVTIDIYQLPDAMYCDLYLGDELIIGGIRAVHAAYINQYASNFVGYLFFYCDNGLDPEYLTLGTTSHLIYADYDALSLDFAAWVLTNE